jgi:hypothetical protein
MDFSNESFTQLAEAGYARGRGSNGDDRLYVTFSMEAEPDAEATLREGRPISRDVEFVKIIVPGDNKNITFRRSNPDDRKRFPMQYSAFKAGESEAVVGTRLKDWPAIRKSEMENLAYFKVHTVEQLAGLSDENIQRIGPVRGLVEKAQAYVAAAKDGAVVEQMREALKAKDNELDTLKRQMTEQREAIARLEKSTGKK